MRGVRTVSRTLNPVLSVALLGALTAAVLCARDLPWRGEWGWTLDWASGSTVLTAPLTAGLAAYQATRWQSVTTGLLLPTARRRIAAAFTPTAVVAGLAVSVCLAGTVAAVMISAFSHPTDSLRPDSSLVGVAKLVTCTSFGWLVGTRLRAHVAAPLSLAACYVLTVVASGRASLSFWLVGGATGPITGKVVDARYTAGATLLFMGLAGLTGAACLVRSAALRRPALVTAAITVAAVGIGAGLTSRPGSAYHRADPHPHRVCRGDSVAVCLLAGNTSQIDAWARAFQQGSEAVRATGATLPSRYEQPTPGGRRTPSVGEVFFDPGTINIRPPDHLYVAESLATPATCPAFAGERPPIAALDAREWLAQWIVARVWPTDPSRRDPRVTRWATTTSTTEQDGWVRTTFAALRSCSLDGIDTPVGR